MCESFDDFAAELRQCFGNEGPLPSSTELRAMKRNDIEKVESGFSLETSFNIYKEKDGFSDNNCCTQKRMHAH